MTSIGRPGDSAHPPGPSGWSGFRNMRQFQRDPLGFLSGLENNYGGLVRFPTGFTPVYLVTDPVAVKHVLQDHYRNYTKNTFTYAMARATTGTNLLTSDGADWLRRRRTVQPLLHRKYVATFVDAIIAETLKTAERWAIRKEPLDIVDEMMRLALNIAGHALFSVDLDRDAETIRRSLSVSTDEVFRQFRSPLALLWTLTKFPSPSSRRFQQAQKWLDEIVFRLIAERRSAVDPPEDILSLLIQTVDAETGQGLTDREIRDEVGILLIAGHETTAFSLVWTWILLAQHPNLQEQLYEEVAAHRLESASSKELLPSLPITEAVMNEALRLYPAVWGFSRRAKQEDEIQGYRIVEGARIMLSPYVTHRSRRYWPNPERFDLSRFLSGSSPNMGAFMPFGMGPRKCIGSSFAWTEILIVVAVLARQYSMQLVDAGRVDVSAEGTLRPSQHVRIRHRLR